VRDAGACDYVGGGAPTLRLRRLQGGPGTVVPSPATLSNPSLSAASASTVSGWSRAMLGVAAVVFVMLGVAWWVRRRRNPDRALNPVAAQPKPRSAMPETEEIRWIAFRDVAGAAPGALSTALPIGLGWRGKHLRLGDPVDVFDRYVEDVAKRVGAAFGVWHLGPFAYGIAAARDTESTRFLLDGDPDDAPEAAADAVARCAVGTSPARWYQVTSQALSEWSTRAPRTVDPLECLAVLEMRGGNAAAAWCELLGMAVPIPREGAPGDKVSETRAALTHAAERRRQRRQSDLTW
jgi:hypothetical protein